MAPLRHQRIAGLADVLAPLTYAVGCTDSAAPLRNYKNHPVRSVRQQYDLEAGSLLRLGITTHERWITAVVGMRVTLRIVFPSLTRQPGFASVHADCAGDGRGGEVRGAVGARGSGRGMRVLDDVWTTGSNAQSAGG